ncbi:MAG: hypothetical protein K0S46_1583 [Moraxellaceae bacterium]|jgi:hypothetical protein|nr:hypothetical protein [Moraxellaceae bacterium]
MNSIRTKITSLVLALGVSLSSLPARADMIDAAGALAASAEASSQRDALHSLLDRADLQAALLREGISAEQASLRVAALSDEEVALVSRHMEELPAGGSVVGAVVFVFIVLLITDILGLTKVFPFTRSIR